MPRPRKGGQTGRPEAPLRPANPQFARGHSVPGRRHGRVAWGDGEPGSGLAGPGHRERRPGRPARARPRGPRGPERPDEDVKLVIEAGRTAAEAHATQLRRSGEPYVTHPIAVATIVAELGLDAPTVAAALLHDAVEDTNLTLEAIEERFGPTVARVVDGVTKLDRLQFDSKEAQQAATIRKMLIAMASDWRVLLIKLADRLHNMQTLAVMPEWKQRRTAQETLDVYAPLAHRLGIEQVKWQLEDLAFATLLPEALRRDRADGGDPGAPARGAARPGCWWRCASASRRPASRPR